VRLASRLNGIVEKGASEEAARSTCNACGGSGLLGFYELHDAPSQTCVLLDSEEESLDYPVGEVLLGFCEHCGFIQNTRFDPSTVDYSKPTEESQAYSSTFVEFAGELADWLVDRYGLTGSHVLEVGCGKGDFLLLLADRGIAGGVGVDPGYLPDRVVREDSQIDFIREAYGPDHTSMTADLVLNRHLMEHIPNVAEFFGWLRKSLSEGSSGVMFTEVPDVERVLREGAFWDVYYEHCSYFTMSSLAGTLGLCGFDVDSLRTGFEDQYLLAGASLGGHATEPNPATASELAGLVASFADDAARSIANWQRRIGDVTSAGGSVAIWGGGSKAVAFIASVGERNLTVVDINPHKQGKWLPSLGVKVEPPSVLKTVLPDLVIAMNPVYLDEIGRHLAQLSPESELTAL